MTMVYLDHAATRSPKAPGVALAVADALGTSIANANRASHRSAIAASMTLYRTRRRAAALLGAADSDRVIFTSGTTLALNMVILGTLRPGDGVLVSPLEHNAVMRPLQRLAQCASIRIDRFRCAPDGSVDLADYRARLAAKPALVVCTACSNVTGVMLPWPELAALARAAGVRFCLDAAQVLGTMPLSVTDTPVDFLCASGHKGLLGPTGTGLLYVAPDVELDAVICGGTGSDSASETQPAAYPDHLESGTLNLAGIAGLGAALEFIAATGPAAVARRLDTLTAAAHAALSAISGITVHSPANAHGVLSFTHAQLSPSALTREFDRHDIAVRCGLHCAPAAHQTIGTYPDGTVRFSFGWFTTEDEIGNAITVLRSIVCGCD